MFFFRTDIILKIQKLPISNPPAFFFLEEERKKKEEYIYKYEIHNRQKDINCNFF